MSILKPFKAFRPKKSLVKQFASRPYDVLSSEEAMEEVKTNPISFLHVVKPEVDLPKDIDHYSPKVYLKGKENLDKLISDGVLIKDASPNMYVYAQTMNEKTQYGLVGCSSVDDYMNNIIKKHELTRPDKEDDRMTHVRTTGVNAEPVFFTYPDNKNIDTIVNDVILSEAEYDFVTADDIRHQLWVISNQEILKNIENIFDKEIPYTYVADGHHRTAAAARVGAEQRAKNSSYYTGNEEYNYFLSVIFPASQLTIIDYNRVIKDLNGLTNDELMEKLRDNFVIQEKGSEIYKPKDLHTFSMYLDNKWYELKAKNNTYDDNDPIDSLDVTVLSKYVLNPILDIKDLRKSTRIDFIGGIRGLGELKKRVDSGEMKVAFAIYPVSMEQLINIADTGNIMPPKTTWFEPKLRSGLVIHDLEIN